MDFLNRSGKLEISLTKQEAQKTLELFQQQFRGIPLAHEFMDGLRGFLDRSRLPNNFNLTAVKKVVDRWGTNSPLYSQTIKAMFDWSDTPQGYQHWSTIASDPGYLSYADIIYLQRLLILHYESSSKG